MKNSEKFIKTLHELSGGSKSLYSELLGIAKENVPQNLDEMDDVEYSTTVRNFVNGPVKSGIDNAFSQIDPDENKSTWEMFTGLAQRANKYSDDKFDRDANTLRNFYKVDDLSKIDEKSINGLAARQGTMPDIIRAELQNAIKNENELNAAKKSAEKSGKEYTTGVKGFVLNDDSKDFFEKGQNTRGYISEALTKGAGAIDLASSFLGPTPIGLAGSVVAPTLRAINRYAVSERPVTWSDIGATGADYLASVGLQAIPGGKAANVGKSVLERFTIGHLGDARFIDDAVKVAAKNDAKLGVKSAENAVKNAESKLAQYTKEASTSEKNMTWAERSAMLERMKQAELELTQARTALEQAKKFETLSLAERKFGSKGARNTAVNATARLLPGAGIFALKTGGRNAADSSDKRPSAEREAEQLGIDARMVRMFRNGYVPPMGNNELFAAYKKWNNNGSKK